MSSKVIAANEFRALATVLKIQFQISLTNEFSSFSEINLLINHGCVLIYFFSSVIHILYITDM